ncbi:hypothetical protein KHC28_26050 [Ancylobacter sonchi]|uniref:DUF6152 family protein n=1 Tax=Ancylobacter sonchi TaxID=1937790 RepID=UPI001BD65026|nr:DUF6152 family protein [Ancylobacter sonchi]MBS7537116.1 hypothetical protein [Ancylobacter sonchi]
MSRPSSLHRSRLRSSIPLAAALALALGVAAAPAFAHHGWSWADGDKMTLTGTIRSISMAPPHPTLHVAASDGTVWRVDLGNPRQTEASGFTADTAKPGDAVTVLGNRSRDHAQAHMKAVRITIAGKNYDMYPERIGDG